jgi:hypothetical protein
MAGIFFGWLDGGTNSIHQRVRLLRSRLAVPFALNCRSVRSEHLLLLALLHLLPGFAVFLIGYPPVGAWRQRDRSGNSPGLIQASLFGTFPLAPLAIIMRTHGRHSKCRGVEWGDWLTPKLPIGHFEKNLSVDAIGNCCLRP